MKATIEDLKKIERFTVEEWDNKDDNGNNPRDRKARIRAYKQREYEFEYNTFERALYVSGDAFGEKKYKVLNELEVLFKVAQEHKTITIKLEGLLFEINNMVLKLNKDKQ